MSKFRPVVLGLLRSLLRESSVLDQLPFLRGQLVALEKSVRPFSSIAWIFGRQPSSELVKEWFRRHKDVEEELVVKFLNEGRSALIGMQAYLRNWSGSPGKRSLPAEESFLASLKAFDDGENLLDDQIHEAEMMDEDSDSEGEDEEEEEEEYSDDDAEGEESGITEDSASQEMKFRILEANQPFVLHSKAKKLLLNATCDELNTPLSHKSKVDRLEFKKRHFQAMLEKQLALDYPSTKSLQKLTWELAQCREIKLQSYSYRLLILHLAQADRPNFAHNYMETPSQLSLAIAAFVEYSRHYPRELLEDLEIVRPILHASMRRGSIGMLTVVLQTLLSLQPAGNSRVIFETIVYLEHALSTHACFDLAYACFQFTRQGMHMELPLSCYSSFIFNCLISGTELIRLVVFLGDADADLASKACTQVLRLIDSCTTSFAKELLIQNLLQAMDDANVIEDPEFIALKQTTASSLDSTDFS